MPSDFRSLEVWQLAIDLADKIYDLAATLPSEERYVLSQQMRDAALSIPSNLAEGKGRWSVREYRQYVRQARGSNYELQSQLLFAHRRKFVSQEKCDELIRDAEKLVAKMSKLIRYLNECAKKRPSHRTTNDR